MDSLLSFNMKHQGHDIPAVKAGDTVRVHQRIKEGEKERVQIFEGLIIKISSGTGTGKTFTIRKTTNGVGVEKIFPFLLPSIEKIELVKRGKTRRSKLYYIRDKQPKEARLKEIPLSDEQKEGLSFDAAALKAEKEAAEKKAEAEKAKAEEKAEKKPEAKEEKKEAEKSEDTKEEKK
jgi:large subunit ribosomal protein L19